MKKLADIGLIGLAVMGENLVLNMESKGYTVALFNRTVERVDAFVEGRGKGKDFIPTHSLEELVSSLSKPRKVMMLVKAGKADGAVSGACHSTSNTLRPALQILKTKQGVKLVSAFFFFVVSDCE